MQEICGGFSVGFRIPFQGDLTSASGFCKASELVCQLYLQQFLSVADLLSIPMNHSKTVVPSTCAVVHRIEIDTLLMQARLPQNKLEAAITLVKSFSRCKKVTLRELQSLIGSLNFVSKVIVAHF